MYIRKLLYQPEETYNFISNPLCNGVLKTTVTDIYGKYSVSDIMTLLMKYIY